MAKITVAGDSIVITSGKKMEDIQTLEKYRPKALALYEANEDGKQEKVFVVGTGSRGSINRFGATFASTAYDGSGLATITLPIPEGTEDVKEYITEVIGVSIMDLNKVEAQIDPAITEVVAEKNAILETITML